MPLKRLVAVASSGLALAFLTGSNCNGGAGGGSGSSQPKVAITLNGVSAPYSGLLIAPSDGFLITTALTSGGASLDLSTFRMTLERWGDAGVFTLAPSTLTLSPTGAVAAITTPLPDGTYTAYASIADVSGTIGSGAYSFAVRGYAASPPIGTGQQIWLDFLSDRDTVAGPDFADDLVAFGLGSTAAPGLSAVAEGMVIERILARVRGAYDDELIAMLGPDPVDVAFGANDFPTGDVTRICIGGSAPNNPFVLGSILLDPGNANRNSVECDTVPPTGIFPRGLLFFAGEVAFQNALDPVTPGIGTPLGEHPEDAAVLAAGFDYASASPPQQQRSDDLEIALQAFADAVGTLVAHEAGHALGLVPPGFPGGGLYGGSSGSEFSHNVDETGIPNTWLYLMNLGADFTFADLAGLEGASLPAFRALNYAYLRDRLRLDPKVTALLPPPSAEAISPDTLDGAAIIVSITGSGFVGPASVAFRNDAFVYQLPSEQVIDDGEIRAWVVQAQVYPGVYDVEVTNGDGQVTVLEDAFTAP